MQASLPPGEDAPELRTLHKNSYVTLATSQPPFLPNGPGIVATLPAPTHTTHSRDNQSPGYAFSVMRECVESWEGQSKDDSFSRDEEIALRALGVACADLLR